MDISHTHLKAGWSPECCGTLLLTLFPSHFLGLRLLHSCPGRLRVSSAYLLHRQPAPARDSICHPTPSIPLNMAVYARKIARFRLQSHLITGRLNNTEY